MPYRLQHLASLDLLYGWKRQRPAYTPPQLELQLPRALPQLRQLRFRGYPDWDALHEALWPLAVLAAHSAAGQTVVDSAGKAAAAGVPPVQTGNPPGARIVSASWTAIPVVDGLCGAEWLWNVMLVRHSWCTCTSD